MTDIHQQEKFLRLCLCSQRDPDALNEAGALAPSSVADWDDLCKQADARRVSPALYYVLRSTTWVPPHSLEKLRKVYERTMQRNLYLFGECKRVETSFRQQNLQVILLKGAALAPLVYANLALRPLRDLDLLVSPDAVEPARACLEKLGYAALPEPQSDATLAQKSEIGFLKSSPKPSRIELHWSLIDSAYYRYHSSMDWFWATARPVRADDAAGLMLGPEAQVLYLCAHLYLHHGGDDLLWLNDIAAVISFYRAEMNWSELLEQSQQIGLVVPAQKILPVIAADWRAPLPAEVLAGLAETPVSPAEARVARWFEPRDRVVARRAWSDLVSFPDWKRRIDFLRVQCFPSGEFMMRRYGIRDQRLVFLYYPYRWWRGVQRTLKG